MGCGSISKVHDIVDEQEAYEKFPADISLDVSMAPESTMVQQSIIRPMTINIIDSQVTIVGASSSSSGMVLSSGAIAIQQLTREEQIPDVSFAAAEEEAIAKQAYRNSVVIITSGISKMQVEDKVSAGGISGNITGITSLGSTAIEKKRLFDSDVATITDQLSILKIDNESMAEHVPDKTAVQIIGTHVISAASGTSSTNIELSNGKIKALIPESYPLPIDLGHPWDYEQSLYYSSEWKDKGSYKLLPLQGAKQKDFEFVRKLFVRSVGDLGDGYEISDITLISDEGDEQAFVAEIDLLEKKHGIGVHGAKWKPKNHDYDLLRLQELTKKTKLNNDEQEELKNLQQKKDAKYKVEQEFNDRNLVRSQLKATRYRYSPNVPHVVPHVKLLPFWHGIKVEDIEKLGESSFSDLIYKNQGELGKGYYGKSDAIAAYEEVSGEDGKLLMLSWYAGKTVYPTIEEDRLTGEPHYANHDLHYSVTAKGHHTAVVFEPGQILPRYLVSIKNRGAVNLGLKQKLQTIKSVVPGKRPLLFQANFSHAIATIAKKRFEVMQAWLNVNAISPLTTSSRLVSSREYDYQKVMMDFLRDPIKEVLLLKTFDVADGELLSRFLEMSLWDSYEEGKPIALHLELSKFSDLEQGNLIQQSLTAIEVSTKAIKDLKDQRKEFVFIISGYEQVKRIPLVKSNYLNRSGGFKGKSIVIVSRNFPDSENYLFYPYGGTEQAARLRVVSNLPKLSQQEKTLQSFFIRDKLEANKYKSLSSKELYFEATQIPQQLAPAPGGKLKPWEYSNALQYSPEWQDKGAFKIHSLKPSDPDYDFAAKLYAHTAMPGYELDEVYLISDRGAEQAFVANLNNLERSATKAEHQPSWDQEDQEISRRQLRAKSIERLEQKSYKTLLTEHVKLLPLWHGTGPAAASGIARSGFASLALVDAGYFGKGLYGSSSAEYSYRVYAKGYNGEKGLLILGWYSAQNVYPVIKWDTYPGVDRKQDKLFGKANYKNYDSHYVLVKPAGEDKKHYVRRGEERTEDTYYPIGEGEKDSYQEFVAFSTAQVLPRYILSLRDIKTKQRLPGMQEFLEKSEIISNDNRLYQHSLERIIADLKESAKSEREQDYMLTQGLSLYIPSQATNSDNIDNVAEKDQYRLEDKTQEFITTEGKELWLLQGNAGSGKSLFGRHLEQDLWSKYKDSDLIPLFIPLPRIGDLSRVDDLIAKALELKGISPYAIAELKARKRFLFILDGYDEIPGKPKLLQQYKFNEEDSWQGKIIVGCRLQYLTAEEEKLLYPKHAGETLTQSIERCMKIYIIPFKQEQVERYIEGFCNSKFNKNDDGSKKWSITQYQEKIAEFKEISEFLKEPFLLFLVLSVLPHLSEKFNSANPIKGVATKDPDAELLVEFVVSSATIKKIDLYDSFTESWFKSQFERMTQHPARDLSQYTSQDILNIFRNYAKKLAFKMFLEETQITTHPLDEDFGKFFMGVDGDAKSKEIAELGFQGSPLKRIGESYLFIHKSFQEYFVARKILDELEDFTIVESVASLQQKLIIDPAILTFISNKLQLTGEKSSKLQENLFKIIEKSRFTEISEYSLAAANAATILNFARIAFSGRNLSGIRIPGADLTGAILDNTNLEGADLREARLKGSWLQGANLKEANMEDSFFGELEYKQHEAAVTSCCYSSDGKYFAVVGGKSIKIYSVSMVINIAEIDSIITDEDINSCCFSMDNKYFAIASGGSIILYSRNEIIDKDYTNKVPYITFIKKITVDFGYIRSVSFSSNNQWLASGGDDNTARLWHLTDSTKNQTLVGHSKSIRSVSFSSDSQWLASGSDDNTVRLWHLKDATKNQTLVGHSKSVRSISFSNDNQWLASGSDDNTVRLWHLKDATKNQTLVGHIYSINNVMFSHNNQWLASGSDDNTVRLWSLTDSGKNQTLAGHVNSVNTVYFSNDNQWLASGSNDKTVRLWSLIYPSNNQTLTGHANWVRSVAFSIDNQWLASGSDDNTIRLWSLIDPSSNQTLIGHANGVYSVTFSYDNRWLASGGGDKTIRLWNLNDFTKNIILNGHTSSVLSLAFSCDNKWLASGGGDKTIKLWNLTEPTKNIALSGHTDSVRSVSFSQDSLWLASGCNDNTVRLWSLIEPKNHYTLTGHTDWVRSVYFSSDNKLLASGSRDCKLRVWSLVDPNDDNQIFIGHTSSVISVAFSYNNQWLASGSSTEIIFWKRANTGNISEIYKQFTIPTNFTVLSLAYSPNLVRLFLSTGGGDYSVRLFEQLPNDKLVLLWTSSQTILCCHLTDITFTSLSYINARLLTQRGATGIPLITESESLALSPANVNANCEIIEEELYKKMSEFKIEDEDVHQKPILFSTAMVQLAISESEEKHEKCYEENNKPIFGHAGKLKNLSL